MDGVLVDSNPWHRLVWRECCRRYGVDVGDDELENWMYGRRNDEILRAFFGDGLTPDEIDLRGREKEALFREKIRNRVLEAAVPGVLDFLRAYRTYPAGLASNAEPANVEFVLGELGLGSRFQAVVTGSDVRRPKPAPEIYLRAAEMLGLEPATCLVFEDSAAGVRSAARAGMRVAGLATSHRLNEFLDAVLKPLPGRGRDSS